MKRSVKYSIKFIFKKTQGTSLFFFSKKAYMETNVQRAYGIILTILNSAIKYNDKKNEFV